MNRALNFPPPEYRRLDRISRDHPAKRARVARVIAFQKTRGCKQASFVEEEDSVCLSAEDSDSDYDYESDLNYERRGRNSAKSNLSTSLDYTFIRDIQKKDNEYIGKFIMLEYIVPYTLSHEYSICAFRC